MRYQIRTRGANCNMTLPAILQHIMNQTEHFCLNVVFIDSMYFYFQNTLSCVEYIGIFCHCTPLICHDTIIEYKSIYERLLIYIPIPGL